MTSGMAFNIVRPNWFMQNFNSYWLGGILSQRKILLPAGQAKASFIDARDIASVAAALLLDGKHDGKAFDLTGAQAIDHASVARALSQAAGKDITYADITPEDFKSGLLAAGLPEDYAAFLVIIMGVLKEGYAARTTDAVREITGRAPISIEQYARDHKSAWANA